MLPLPRYFLEVSFIVFFVIGFLYFILKVSTSWINDERSGIEGALVLCNVNLGNCLSKALYTSVSRQVKLSHCCLFDGELILPRCVSDLEDAEAICEDENTMDFGDMIHETRPWEALKLAEAQRKYFEKIFQRPQGSPKKEGVTVIHIRCSDVPRDESHNYELIEYEWYVAALQLLPAEVRRRIIIKHCFSHPDLDNERVTKLYICRSYVDGLKDVLTEAGFECQMDLSCGDVRKDFLSLSDFSAIVSGGCGGSFGFWAGALSPPDVYAVLPSVRSTLFLELGSPDTARVGRKTLLRAERVRNQILREQGIRLNQLADVSRLISLCRNVRRPTWPVYDGCAYYINRSKDKTRREHMEEELAAHGFRATRFEPIPDPSPTVSLTKTHLRILEIISSQREGWTAIFEDDVSFHGTDVLKKIREFIPRVNMFAYLGMCFECPEKVASTTHKRGMCTHAYIVCPEGASYLAWIIRTRIIRTNKYALKNGIIIDSIFMKHVKAPLLGADLRSSREPGHHGIAFQDRTASWYRGSTLPY